MTLRQSGPSAYKQTIRETETPRDLERRVISQITRELEKLPPAPTPSLSHDDRDALARNQRMWGFLMFDVIEADNPLPDQLKAGIISLALFVDQHTPEVIAGRKTAEALVSINRNVMSGMAGATNVLEAQSG